MVAVRSADGMSTDDDEDLTPCAKLLLFGMMSPANGLVMSRCMAEIGELSQLSSKALLGWAVALSSGIALDKRGGSVHGRRQRLVGVKNMTIMTNGDSDLLILP